LKSASSESIRGQLNRPGHKGAGIDVDAVGMKFHVQDRGMAVRDNLSESLFALEKFVPDPAAEPGAL
jgi:hypothetical protein